MVIKLSRTEAAVCVVCHETSGNIYKDVCKQERETEKNRERGAWNDDREGKTVRTVSGEFYK